MLAVLVVPASCALPRIALYEGPGTSWNESAIYLKQMVADGTITSFTKLTAEEVDAGLSTDHFDMLMVPGGSSNSEATGLHPVGLTNIQKFVTSGGGYMGTCAGAYLASEAYCCDTKMVGYCNGSVGCFESTNRLKMVNFANAEPWNRGHGPVNVTFTDEAVAMLHLPVEHFGGGVNISIIYWQGPIHDRNYHSSGFTTLATFRSEIALIHPDLTTGQMVGTPAMITSTYGQGRVLLSTPHPEIAPPIMDLLKGMIYWVSKVI